MYHKNTRGYKVFWVHRISGLLILGYLYLHLVLLSAILLPSGAAHFNAVARFVEQSGFKPGFIVAEIVLFAIIVVHALNGIRLIAADFGAMIRENRLAIWLTMGVGAVLVFIAVLMLFPHIAG